MGCTQRQGGVPRGNDSAPAPYAAAVSPANEIGRICNLGGRDTAIPLLVTGEARAYGLARVIEMDDSGRTDLDRFAIRRLAALTVTAKPKPREHSWGHAVVRWADGTTREGWLRLGEAQQWTGTVPAEVVRLLLTGTGKPGAFTPAALFGSSLAESCGAEYVV